LTACAPSANPSRQAMDPFPDCIVEVQAVDILAEDRCANVFAEAIVPEPIQTAIEKTKRRAKLLADEKETLVGPGTESLGIPALVPEITRKFPEISRHNLFSCGENAPEGGRAVAPRQFG
jgi:hypothetical protein